MEKRIASTKGTIRRSQILKIAHRSFVDGGYAGLSMRDVARQCDINLKNLQYYFRTKEDLFIAIARDAFEETVFGLSKLVDTTGNSSGKIFALEEIIFDAWGVKTSSIWLHLYSMANHSKKLRDLKIELYQKFYLEIGALLKNVYPDADKKAIYNAARILTALMDGVALARIPGKGDPLDFKSLEEEIKKVSVLIVKNELGIPV